MNDLVNLNTAAYRFDGGPAHGHVVNLVPRSYPNLMSVAPCAPDIVRYHVDTGEIEVWRHGQRELGIVPGAHDYELRPGNLYVYLENDD